MIKVLHSALPTTDSSPAKGKAGTDSQQTLLNRLATHLPGMDSKALAALNQDDFSPDKIAERIGGFVAQGLDAARRAGRSEADIQSMYQAAVKGVEQGFAEAREILDNLGVLSGSIASNIDLTEQKTQQALAAIDPARADSPAFSRLTLAERFAKAESLSLSIQTRDGDQVTINFAHSATHQYSAGIEQQNGQQQSVFNLSRHEQSDYQFSVQGDLDNDEIDALQNLIKDMAEIANDFFAGDLQQAFASASTYRLDRTELAAMNLQLTRTEQYSSISRYQQVEQLQTPAAMKRLDHLVNQVAQTSTHPALAFVEELQPFTQTLLETLITQDQRFQTAEPNQQERFSTQLSWLSELLARPTSASAQPTQA